MLKLFSPAKVNFFLRISDLRKDGYHELASLFQAIDLGDDIELFLSPKDEFQCSDSTLGLDNSNLIIQALFLFRKKTKLLDPVSIKLDKKIPIGAGLGGGSSNAATILWGLNDLFGSPASLEDLKLWTASIGSDITFFLSHGTAFCTGKGEKLLEVTLPERKSFWLVKPQEGLSTKLIYSELDLKNTSSRSPIDLLKVFLNKTPEYINDLEKPAFKIMPGLIELRNKLLEAGFEHVVMTGSGTAFICIGDALFPTIPDHKIFRVTPLNRLKHTWFQPEHTSLYETIK